MKEIERKFLVKSNDYKKSAVSETLIMQGFLNLDPARTVRVRVKGDEGYITVKGLPNATGTTRFEWEKKISAAEAQELMNLCEGPIINKIRYEVPVGAHIFEIDEFNGVNKGLLMAEIELETEDEAFIKPEWLGTEVTGLKKYYNSQLSIKPFTEW